MSRKFVGGNWKCNNTLEQTAQLIELLAKLQPHEKVDVVVAPPALHLLHVQAKLPGGVQVAAQNCSSGAFGAFTGEISPLHLKDAKIPWVILGHSQRRTLYGQTDDIVAKKVEEALKVGLQVIACFGQTLAEREAGNTFGVLEKQLKALIPAVGKGWQKVVLAYEPVWAIGTGKTATREQVGQVHSWIRKFLGEADSESQKSRVIYGGSVTEKNCAELISVEKVDGFLVGGASLKPSFLDIVHACLPK